MTAQAGPAAQPLKAALWMAASIVSFSAMAVAGRSLASELDTFETMLYRSLVGVVLVVAVCTARGLWPQVETRRFRLHLMRNAFHFTGQNLWFFAITVAPLAQVFAVEFSSPLWVALAAPFFLKERLTLMRAFAALLGFVGILVVARPTFTNIDPGLAAVALAAMFFAATNITTKVLTRDQSIICIMFWLTVMQAVFGLITSGFDGDITLPSLALWPWVFLVGSSGLFAHYCLTTALSLAPATIVVPFDFMRLPVIAVVGMLVYNEALDIFVLIGAVIVFSANYLNVWTDSRSRRRAAKNSTAQPKVV
ncbi:DMT family transporter [Oceaniglobus ichthyenteri]|uniref:DMT family transporter n=1 Tax=Oceaniglobus ichthyenteri TaxID=2136177 RepID=UPI003B82F20B